MKTKEELKRKILVNRGYSVNELCGYGNTVDLYDAMDDYASQSLSSKIEEVREKVSDEKVKLMCANYFEKKPKDFDNIYVSYVDAAKEIRDLIISSLEGEG